MSFTIRRSRAALHKLDPDQEFWHDAKLIAQESGGAILETHWKNADVSETWVLRYTVLKKCFRELKRQRLIEPDESDDCTYRLSKSGKQRLG